jgi:hypothetical protein
MCLLNGVSVIKSSHGPTGFQGLYYHFSAVGARILPLCYTPSSYTANTFLIAQLLFEQQIFAGLSSALLLPCTGCLYLIHVINHVVIHFHGESPIAVGLMYRSCSVLDGLARILIPQLRVDQISVRQVVQIRWPCQRA